MIENGFLKIERGQVPYPKDFVEVRTPTRLKGGTSVTPGFVRERKKRTSQMKNSPSPMKRAPGASNSV